MKSLTLPQARNLVLHAQGLYHDFGKGKKGSLNAIEHLGYVQIDTLAVVERAHHHTLWARNKSYAKKQLEELQKSKDIFEYWSHAASYLPMKDYRFSLLRKQEYLKGREHWFAQDRKVIKQVLERIKKEGPLLARDFENPAGSKGVWYDWKPAKKALEQLFMDGTLMVAGRQNFQKVYDLAERVLPAGINTSLPTEKEYAEHLILSASRANGLVTEREITYLRSKYREAVKKGLPRLLKEGRIVKVQVEGVGEDHYALPELVSQTDKAPPKELHILSPFDNLLIQRKRMEKFFGFSYFIECYLPEHKRVYGYFTLPLLWGDAFIGRADMKADQHSGTLYVKKLFLEKDTKVTDALLQNMKTVLRDFAAFNGCETIKVEATDRKGREDKAIRSIG